MLASAFNRVYDAIRSRVVFETTVVIGTSTFYGGQSSYGYRASNVPHPMGQVDKPRLDDGSLIKIINWHLYGRIGGIVLEGNHVNTSFDKIIIDDIEIPLGTVQYDATYNERTVSTLVPENGTQLGAFQTTVIEEGFGPLFIFCFVWFFRTIPMNVTPFIRAGTALKVDIMSPLIDTLKTRFTATGLGIKRR